MPNVNETLKQRGKVYGKFSENARTTREVYAALQDGCVRNDTSLTDSQWKALVLISAKLGRICSCTASMEHVDNWRDVAGYAELIVRELEKAAVPPPLQEFCADPNPDWQPDDEDCERAARAADIERELTEKAEQIAAAARESGEKASFWKWFDQLDGDNDAVAERLLARIVRLEKDVSDAHTLINRMQVDGIEPLQKQVGHLQGQMENLRQDHRWQVQRVCDIEGAIPMRDVNARLDDHLDRIAILERARKKQFEMINGQRGLIRDLRADHNALKDHLMPRFYKPPKQEKPTDGEGNA